MPSAAKSRYTYMALLVEMREFLRYNPAEAVLADTDTATVVTHTQLRNRQTTTCVDAIMGISRRASRWRRQPCDMEYQGFDRSDTNMGTKVGEPSQIRTLFQRCRTCRLCQLS